MNKDELNKLQAELEAKEQRLVKQLRSIAIENPAVEGDFEPSLKDATDRDDGGLNASSEMDRNFAMEQELENELEDVRSALDRIKKGAYGVCANCSEKITPERLKAMPVAVSCINCAKKAQLS